MPIFEYLCDRCGERFEKLVTSASARVACPACAGKKVRKQFSRFGSRSGGRVTAGGSGCGTCSKSSCASCR